MTNAYENDLEIDMADDKCHCFKPVTFKTVLHVLRRMFR
jgi:hypothetical protein